MPTFDVDVPIIAQAELEARALGHSYLGNEHILIALAADEAHPIDAFVKRAITPSVLREAALDVLGDAPAIGSATLRLSHRTQASLGAAIAGAHSRQQERRGDSAADQARVAFTNLDLLRETLRAEASSKSVVSAMLLKVGAPPDLLLKELNPHSA